MPSPALLGGMGDSGPAPRNFRQVLNFAHLALLPRTYVEVGIREGASLSLALPRTRTVGIDPKPKIRKRTGVQRSAMLFRETSDAFFDSHDLTDVLGGRPVDLAFVDGMHLFEFALRDFINLERHSTPASTVLLHDCYPFDEATAAREKRTRKWSGDVWKLIVILKRYRPRLDVSVIDVRPTGLGVVRGLDPSDTTLSDRYDEICRELMPLPYDYLAEDKDEKLNRVPGEWSVVRSLLPPRGGRRGMRVALRSGRLARKRWAQRRATMRRKRRNRRRGR